MDINGYLMSKKMKRRRAGFSNNHKKMKSS